MLLIIVVSYHISLIVNTDNYFIITDSMFPLFAIIYKPEFQPSP